MEKGWGERTEGKATKRCSPPFLYLRFWGLFKIQRTSKVTTQPGRRWSSNDIIWHVTYVVVRYKSLDSFRLHFVDKEAVVRTLAHRTRKKRVKVGQPPQIDTNSPLCLWIRRYSSTHTQKRCDRSVTDREMAMNPGPKASQS